MLALSGGGGLVGLRGAFVASGARPAHPCIFVDHGFMRPKTKSDECRGRVFRPWICKNFIHVDAADRFLAKLAGVTDP